jgi:Tol biopolymer transport system component
MAVAMLILVGVSIGYLIWSLTRPAESAPVLRMHQLTNSGHSKLASISPDGRYVAYVIDDLGKQSLWIRLIATAGVAQIVPPAEVYYGGLTFSPDSSYLYYITREKKDRNSTLYQVAAIGGAGRS